MLGFISKPFSATTSHGGSLVQNPNAGITIGSNSSDIFATSNTMNFYKTTVLESKDKAINSENGTASETYRTTPDKDPFGVITIFHSISAMPTYQSYSFEELRLQDYQQGRKTSQTRAIGGVFGSTNLAGFSNYDTTNHGIASASKGISLFGDSQNTDFGKATGSAFEAPTSAFFNSAPTVLSFSQPVNMNNLGNTWAGFGKPFANSFNCGTRTDLESTTVNSASNITPEISSNSSAPTVAAISINPNIGLENGNALMTTTTPTGFEYKPNTSVAGFKQSDVTLLDVANACTTHFSSGPNSNNNTGNIVEPIPSTFESATTTVTPNVSSHSRSSAPDVLSHPTASTQTTSNLFSNTTSTVISNPFIASMLLSNTHHSSCLFGPKPTTTSTPPFSYTFNPDTGLGTTFGPGNNNIGHFSIAPRTVPIHRYELQASIDENPYGNNPLFSNIPKNNSPLRNSDLSSIPVTTTTDQVSPRVQVTQKKIDGSTYHSKTSPRSVAKVKLRGFNSQSPVKPFTPGSTPEMIGLSELELNDPLASPEVYPLNPSKPSIASDGTCDSPKEEGNANASPMVNNTNHVEYGAPNSQSITALKPSSNPDLSSHINDISLSILHEYWTSPTLSTLQEMTPQQLKRVKEFEVGRSGYGQVRFLQPIDLSDISSLDRIPGELIHFERKFCSVFSNEISQSSPGEGFNIPAIITLNHCWPLDKATRHPIKDMKNPRLMQHVKKLKNISTTKFLDFNYETGTWSFMVNCF
ncbi:hypothetical protein K7432_008255 [Basidiobolus ranarum]|uniref:Peptidase S59 domain-containing protein n=1 Tax=Basidiobolus ranarum TaxID=34480 RepID=A0ABR2WS20_9FUNG